MDSESVGEDCNFSIGEREEWKKFDIKELYRNQNYGDLKFKNSAPCTYRPKTLSSRNLRESRKSFWSYFP